MDLATLNLVGDLLRSTSDLEQGSGGAGFWPTAGGVALGAAVGSGIAVVGQWLADRRAGRREKARDNALFRERATENMQEALKELWHHYSTTRIIRAPWVWAPRRLTQALVNASAWRSRLQDQELAHEIKEWMDDVADACGRRLPSDERAALVISYRAIMARLGADLQQLHED